MIVGAIVGVNLATAWGSGFSPDVAVSPGLLVVWCFVFMLNAVAGGFALNLVEAIFVVARRDPSQHSPLKGDYNIQDYVLAVNAMIGLWSFFAGIPLFFIACLAYQGDVGTQVFLDWSSFTSPSGQLYIFIMGLASWLYTALAYFVISKSNALWTTVTQNTVVICQIAFLSQPIAGIYQSIPATSDWINNALLCTISALYALGQPEKEKNIHKIKQSWIGQMYEKAFQKVSDDIPDFN